MMEADDLVLGRWDRSNDESGEFWRPRFFVFERNPISRDIVR